MASSINSTSAGNGGLVSTGDDSGILNIQTNETTAITVSASQIVSYTNNLGTVAGYPAYQCRAWVNFDGTGTVAIRASGNVSSITDNGTGDYTINFTTAMPDANYSAATQILQNAARIFTVNGLSASSLNIICRQLTENPADNAYISATVFR